MFQAEAIKDRSEASIVKTPEPTQASANQRSTGESFTNTELYETRTCRIPT